MGKKYKIEQSKSKQKWNILGNSDSFIEKDMITGPHIEIFGNNMINLDGCIGVVEYKDTYIKLKLQKGQLILCGNNLDIAFFEGRLITVKGKISSVEFCV